MFTFIALHANSIIYLIFYSISMDFFSLLLIVNHISCFLVELISLDLGHCGYLVCECLHLFLFFEADVSHQRPSGKKFS